MKNRINTNTMETAIQKRNNEIIGATYQKIRQDIFSIFRQACIEESVCEDLVQDVFLKILGLDVIIEEQLKGLAVFIAYQKRIDYLRHTAFVRRAKNDYLWRMEQSYTNTDAEVNDILHVEMRIVSRMSEQDANVYQLMRFENKTADEIALYCGLSKRAVESRIYRTRQQVREGVRCAIGF